MIRRAEFRNFKSLHDLDCDLSRFTIIVGESGSGKTSILDGLSYVAQSARRRVADILLPPFSPQNLWSRGAREPTHITVSGHAAGQSWNLELRIDIRPDDTDDPGWTAYVQRTWGVETLGVDDRPTDHGRRDDRDAPGMRALASALGAALKLRLDAREIVKPSYSEADVPRLAPSGAGLPSVLADLALRAPDVFQEIQRAARAIVPRLERIRLQAAKVRRAEPRLIRVDDEPPVETSVQRWLKGEQIVLDFVGAQNIPAPLASEGTLLSIALATVLHQERRPRLLLLDDIDQSLHPTAQRALVTLLRKVQELDSDLQVVATSHSPYFLDCFEPEEVLITASRSDGSTACARLSEHPEIARWKDVAKSGEIWSFVGEDWVTGERSGESA